MQPLGTKKNHTTSWGKKCPKNSILVTNKLQEIGTGHLGLVFVAVVSVVVVFAILVVINYIITITSIITSIFSNFRKVYKTIISVFPSYVLLIMTCLSLLTPSLAWPGQARDEAGKARQGSSHKVSKMALAVTWKHCATLRMW